jgi:hypothetical protein
VFATIKIGDQFLILKRLGKSTKYLGKFCMDNPNFVILISSSAFRLAVRPDVAQNCHKHFPTEAELQQHLGSCVTSGPQPQLKLIAPKKPCSVNSQGHKCQLCGERLESVELLKAHFNSHWTLIPGKNNFNLDKSALVSFSPEELQEHGEQHLHTPSAELITLEKVLESSSTLEKPLLHGAMLYPCLLCGKNLLDDSSFKIHVAMHFTDTPGIFKCIQNACQQLFENADSLKNHFKEAHKEVKPFECRDCLHSYKTERDERSAGTQNQSLCSKPFQMLLLL